MGQTLDISVLERNVFGTYAHLCSPVAKESPCSLTKYKFPRAISFKYSVTLNIYQVTINFKNAFSENKQIHLKAKKSLKATFSLVRDNPSFDEGAEIITHWNFAAKGFERLEASIVVFRVKKKKKKKQTIWTEDFLERPLNFMVDFFVFNEWVLYFLKPDQYLKW